MNDTLGIAIVCVLIGAISGATPVTAFAGLSQKPEPVYENPLPDLTKVCEQATVTWFPSGNVRIVLTPE